MRKYWHWFAGIALVVGLQFLGYQNLRLGLILLIFGAIIWLLTHETARTVWSTGTHDTKTLLLSCVITLVLAGTAGGLLFRFVIAPKPPCRVLAFWGTGADQNANASIDTRELKGERSAYRVMLICRAGDNTIDAGDDDHILKSAVFSITGELLPIEIPMPDDFRAKLRKVRHLEFYVAEIPASVGPEQIANIYGLEKLGGKILDSEGMTVNFQPETPRPQPSPAPTT